LGDKHLQDVPERKLSFGRQRMATRGGLLSRSKSEGTKTWPDISKASVKRERETDFVSLLCTLLTTSQIEDSDIDLNGSFGDPSEELGDGDNFLRHLRVPRVRPGFTRSASGNITSRIVDDV
jgi:hypothetical protein